MVCNCKERETDLSLLEPFLQGYNEAGDEGGLITLLQQAQELYGWLPHEALMHIAGRTRIKPAKIMGVVSFYTQFRTKPAGKNLILLCQGTACHVNGSADIEAVIKERLSVEEGEMTADGLFTYNNAVCLGCCSLSPVMTVGGKTYGGLTKEKTITILRDAERKDGGA
jgi:NADH-quinone oxidoreductase subunit E